jgi:hypothetical protein
MRFRLQTTAPLPPVKAWVSFSSTGHETVYALKTHLCAVLEPLQRAHIGPGQIKLELDGFELLDDGTAAELLHENDLLVALPKLEQTPTMKGKKRKMDEMDEPRVAFKIVPKKRIMSLSSSSSSDSDSSSTSSSSSASSSSSSSSDSDTDSDSDSSGSSTPSIKTIRKSKAP